MRNLSRLLSDVADRRDHLLVSRHGKPAAAVVPVDEYEALDRELLEPDWRLIDAIEDALGLLEREPRSGHALRGRLRGLRSLRVGA